MRAKTPYILAATGATLLLAAFALRWLPWPQCPIRQYLGFDCPMCGTTHAFVAAGQGAWVEALHANPFFVWWGALALFSYVVLWLRVTDPASRNPWWLRLLASRQVLWVQAIAFVGGLLWRNIPHPGQ